MSGRPEPPPWRRPPWWPENEPFPPRRRWRGGPPPFLRWIGCLFLFALGMAALAGGFVGASFGRYGFHPFVLFPIVLVIVIALAASGGMRRMTRPVSNLVEAARRIESGDYSATVPEWGSADVRSVARAFNSMSARLKAIDEQRRSFLADVAHELRTPLAVIRGQAEAISDGVYPADPAHLAPILDATHTLERLVEDLRTLIQTDAGSLELHRESTDLGILAHDAVESFRSQAEGAGVNLATAVEGEPLLLDLDPARMRQVIGNLLSNAIHHTPSGGAVKVTVTTTSGQVALSVADTGEGIPPDLLPRVFERFVKGPASTGSGLGLAIAHDIVKAHGGSLDVNSEPGHGSTFVVKLRGAG